MPNLINSAGLPASPFRCVASPDHPCPPIKSAGHKRSSSVEQITSNARALQAQGYLLKSDADAIIAKAMQSDIGK
ncbi:MAG: hypothetical protein ACXWIU_03410 [Limisphaerales bacterium]